MKTLPMEQNACQHTHNAVDIYIYRRTLYALTRSKRLVNDGNESMDKREAHCMLSIELYTRSERRETVDEENQQKKR